MNQIILNDEDKEFGAFISRFTGVAPDSAAANAASMLHHVWMEGSDSITVNDAGIILPGDNAMGKAIQIAVPDETLPMTPMVVFDDRIYLRRELENQLAAARVLEARIGRFAVLHGDGTVTPAIKNEIKRNVESGGRALVVFPSRQSLERRAGDFADATCITAHEAAAAVPEDVTTCIFAECEIMDFQKTARILEGLPAAARIVFSGNPDRWTGTRGNAFFRTMAKSNAACCVHTGDRPERTTGYANSLKLLESGETGDAISTIPRPAWKVELRELAKRTACWKRLAAGGLAADETRSLLGEYRIITFSSGGAEGFNQSMLEMLGMERGAVGTPVVMADDDSTSFISGKDEVTMPDGPRKIPEEAVPMLEPRFAIPLGELGSRHFKKVLVVFPRRESAYISGEMLKAALRAADESAEIWGDESLVKLLLAENEQPHSLAAERAIKTANEAR